MADQIEKPESWLDGLDGVKEIISAEGDGDVTMPRRPRIRFIGATVEDDPVHNRTDVTFGGGGGGGGEGGVSLSNAAPVVVTPSVGTAGTSDDVSRADHRHQVATGTPVAVGDALAPGVANSLARSDHVHTVTLAGDVTGPRNATLVEKIRTVPVGDLGGRTTGQVLTWNGSVITFADAPSGGGGGGAPLSNATPVAVTPATGTAGVSTDASRADHRHQVVVGSPVAVGDALSAGGANSLARSDHVHTVTLAGDVTGSRSTTVVEKIRTVPVGDLSGRSNGQVLTWNASSSTIVFADAPSGGGGGADLSDSVPVALTAATGVAGVAGTASRSDHRHQVTVATPRTVGVANLPGSSTSLVRADHEHELTARALGLVEQGNTAMEPFGVASHWNAIEIYPLLVRAGVQWIRMDLHWYQCEPTQGSFNWTFFDAGINAAKGYGLKILAVLGKPPPWSNGGNNDSYSPTAAFDGAWQNYVNQTVNRYAETVDAWEVWNEPNHDFFLRLGGATWADVNFPGDSAVLKKRKQYVHLLDLAMTQGDLIHKLVTTSGFASGGDWDSGFIPYLAGLGSNWLTQWKVGNTHAYGFERPNQYEVLRFQINQLIDIGDAQGKTDWPIWMTEHGIFLPPGTGTESDDTRFFTRSYAEALRMRNCHKLFWFPSQYLTDHHALLTAANQPTALYRAYQTLTQMWRHPVSVDPWDDPATSAEGAIATLADGRRVAIVWNDGTATTLGGISLKWYHAFDRMGVRVDASQALSGGAPWYLELSKGWGEITTFPYDQPSANASVGDVPVIFDAGGGEKRWRWDTPGAAPDPTLAGDVTGASSANTVSKLQTKVLNIGSPIDGQVLTWDSGTNTIRFETPASGVALSDVTPASVSAAAGAAGNGVTAARWNHVHQVVVGVPVSVGSANSAGVNTTLARSDHVHDASTKADKTTTVTAGNGLTGGGNLGTSFSIDVASSDGSINIFTNAIAVNFSGFPPLVMGNAYVGVATTASRSDHIHPRPTIPLQNKVLSIHTGFWPGSGSSVVPPAVEGEAWGWLHKGASMQHIGGPQSYPAFSPYDATAHQWWIDVNAQIPPWMVLAQITGITVRYRGASGHAAMPANKPTIQLLAYNEDLAPALYFSGTDPTTTTTAFQAAHDITATGGPYQLETSNWRYYLIVSAETGANRKVGAEILAAKLTGTFA